MEKSSTDPNIPNDAASLSWNRKMSVDFVKGYVTGFALILFTVGTIMVIRLALRWYRDPEVRPTILHTTKRHTVRDFSMDQIKQKTAKRSKKTNKVTSYIVRAGARTYETNTGTSSSPETATSGSKMAVNKPTSVAGTSATDSSEPEKTKMLKMSLTHDDEAEGADAIASLTNNAATDMITGFFIGFFFILLVGLLILLFELYRYPETQEFDGLIKVERRSVDHFFTNLANLYKSGFGCICIPWSPEQKEVIEGYMGLLLVAVLAFLSVYRCVVRVYYPERRRVWLCRDMARYHTDRQKISGE